MHAEPTFEPHLRIARIVSLATCVGAPLAYLLVLFMARFHGDGNAFLAALRAPQSWTHPAALGLLAVSGASLSALGAVDLLVKPRPGSTRGQQLKFRTIIQSALLESVAVYGLVLAFLLDPAPLAPVLSMILTPVLGVVLIFPSAARWEALASGRR